MVYSAWLPKWRPQPKPYRLRCFHFRSLVVRCGFSVYSPIFLLPPSVFFIVTLPRFSLLNFYHCESVLLGCWLTSWLGLPFRQFHNINFITKEKHLQNLGPASQSEHSVILLLLHSSEVTVASYQEFVHHQQVLRPKPTVRNKTNAQKNFPENIKNQIAVPGNALFNFHLRTAFLLSQF